MKQWSLARFAFIVWFLAYAVFALLSLMTPSRPSIFELVVRATVAMFLTLLIVGFIQED